MDQFGVIGIDFHTTMIIHREQTVFSQESKLAFINNLDQSYFNGIVILSTCNRTEIYFSAIDGASASKYLLSQYVNFINDTTISNNVYSYSQSDALKHLLQVAIGFKSQIKGEDQILGQLKIAYENAQKSSLTNKTINKIFQTTFNLAKEIKSQHPLSNIPFSAATIAIQMIINNGFDIKDKNVLLIGASKMNAIALQNIIKHKPRNIYMTNRSFRKLELLKAKYPSLQQIIFADRYATIAKCDLIISATSSPNTLIKSTDLINSTHNSVFIDLAVPRDIDDTIGDIKNFKL